MTKSRFSLIDKIEGTSFFTGRNIVLLLVIGALSSVVLIFMLPVRSFWRLVPIVLYAGVNAGLLVSHVRGRGGVSPQRTLLLKSASDILLTVYWTNLYAWETGLTLFYFLPVLIMTAIILYHTRSYRSYVLNLCLYSAVLLNGVVFVLVVGISNVGGVGIGVYYLLTLHAIWAHRAHIALRSRVRKEMASAEERVEELVNSAKTLELAARIVRHDINNHLMSACASLPGQGSRKEYLQCYETLVKPINERLKLLWDRTPVDIELQRVLLDVMPVRHSYVDIERSIRVRMPFLLLVSLLKNVCDNAQEAYLRKNQSLDGFMLSAHMVGNTLELTDNAGGFDVRAVKIGVSEKGEGHGVFLVTFLKDTRHLGLHTGIRQVQGGTVVFMTFETIVTGEHADKQDELIPENKEAIPPEEVLPI